VTYQSETPGRRSVQIGRVFSRASKALADCPGPFLVIAAALLLAPDILVALLVRQSPDASSLERLLNSAENLTVGAIGRGALIFAALKVMQTGKVSASDSFAAGVRFWGPVLGISILTGLGALLGMLLLIVPGIFLAVAWSIALPVRIDGKPGVTDAMVQSFEMTRGSRWAIFAVWLIFAVVAILCFALIGGLSALAGAADGVLFDLVVAPLLTAVFGIGAAVLSASVYEDLTLGGGGSATRTADIFT
jgi:hypothetical protein